MGSRGSTPWLAEVDADTGSLQYAETIDVGRFESASDVAVAGEHYIMVGTMDRSGGHSAALAFLEQCRDTDGDGTVDDDGDGTCDNLDLDGPGDAGQSATADQPTESPVPDGSERTTAVVTSRDGAGGAGATVDPDGVGDAGVTDQDSGGQQLFGTGGAGGDATEADFSPGDASGLNAGGAPGLLLLVVVAVLMLAFVYYRHRR